MEQVRRSNTKLSKCPSSKSALREEALAAWRFKPSDTAKDHNADAAWIFEASQRDMEIVTRALVTELNSTPDGGAIIGTSNETNAGPCTSGTASSSISSCDPGSPFLDSVEANTVTSVEVSVSMARAAQFEAPGTRNPPAEALSRSYNNQRSIPAMNSFIGKKRSRRANRDPITIMRAHPADFQAMIQQMTGSPLKNSSRAAPSLLKPQPKRPGLIGSNIIPTGSSSLGFPVGINGLIGTCPNYLRPAAFCNNLSENSECSVGTETSINSHFNSMGIDKGNSLQSEINTFAQRYFWN